MEAIRKIMEKCEIEKIIKKYTIKKYILIFALFGSCLFFIVSILFIKNQNISIIAYILLLLIVALAYLFPLNCKLSKNLSADDFHGILDYLIYIADDQMNNQLYFESLVMIKNSLNEIAHYHMEHEEQYIKDCIYYLQGQFNYGKNSQIIPLKLYNRKYLKNLCAELRIQIAKGMFDANILQNINDNADNINKKRRIFKLSLVWCCNVILICIFAGKFVITWNINYYDKVNNDIFLRVFYNLGADSIAVVLAIASLIHKNK